MSRWEDEHSLKGLDFDTAMEHLKHQGIMELSDQFGANDLSNRILNCALDPFRWDVTLSVPVPGACTINVNEPTINADSATFDSNVNSINILLNAADHIAGSRQGQHSPKEIHSFTGEEVRYTVASGQLETHRKRRRIDPPLSIPCNGIPNSLQQSNGHHDPEVAVEAIGMNIAKMAVVDKLENTLGTYVFKGMVATRMRGLEKDRRWMKFTDTVRLHINRTGEDYKLEVWLHSSTGKSISQATKGTADDLCNKLGKYLFSGMMTSNWRKEKEKQGIHDFSGAVFLCCPDGIDHQEKSDWKMEVILSSRIGLEIYKNVFPSFLL
jgi:hypothetical protein